MKGDDPILFHVVEPVSNGMEKRKDVKATTKETKINLLTLQRVDKSVCEIVKTMPHVVLYQFKSTENVLLYFHKN